MWRIDQTQIPPDKRYHPEVLKLLDSIENTDPLLTTAICVHEAAHGIYMRKAGAIDLRFKGMTIFWDASKGEFDIAAAAIAPTFGDDWKISEDNIDMIARYHAAGGAATITLTSEVNPMDRDDLDKFRKVCSSIPNAILDADKLWREAQAHVLSELQRDHKLKKEIWRLEKEFKTWLLSAELARDIPISNPL